MARQTYFSPMGDASGLQPTVLATPGDLEEARIRRLIDLAKLVQLQQDPLIQQQQLNLQRQRLALEGTTAAETGRHDVVTENQATTQLAEMVRQHHVDSLLKQAGMDVEQRSQDVNVRGQDILARGQDVGLLGERERTAGETLRSALSNRTQTTDTLIHAMLGLPDISGKNQDTLAKVLALRGDPELLKVLEDKTQAGTGDPVADATLAYMKAKAAGKTPTNATNAPNTGTGGVGDLLKKLFIPGYALYAQ